MDCIFCKIVNGEIPCHKIYEDDDFLVFLDMYPINTGHALVIPKVHSDNIFSIENDVASKYFVVIKKVADVVKSVVNADGINIGMNNLPAAGQVVFHSHVHIIPRFNNDGLVQWGSRETTKEELEKIAENMRNLIK